MAPWTKKIIIAVVVVVLGCVVSYFGFLAGAAVIGYRAVMRADDETATLRNLKTIAAAEAQYFISHDRTFASLEQLIDEQLLSAKFRQPADGYVFSLTFVRKLDGSSWYKISADPQNNKIGTNHFYIDSDDQRIRANPDRQAGPADPDF